MSVCGAAEQESNVPANKDVTDSILLVCDSHKSMSETLSSYLLNHLYVSVVMITKTATLLPVTIFNLRRVQHVFYLKDKNWQKTKLPESTFEQHISTVHYCVHSNLEKEEELYSSKLKHKPMWIKAERKQGERERTLFEEVGCEDGGGGNRAAM